MSILPLQPHGRPRRPLPVVNYWGVLERVVHDDTHDSRRIEHQKMRQTWFQTIIGFVLLGLILGGTAYWLGGLSLLGIIGIVWLSIMGTAWFFSAKIATFVVGAYTASPGTKYGDMAIRCTDRAWALLMEHVRSHYGDHVADMMIQPPVMLAPSKHANAFCTGRSWKSAAIVMFEGLMDAGMTEDEIVAVLAHELGHYFFGDVFIQTVAAMLGAVFTLTVTGAVQRFVRPFFGGLHWLFRWPVFLAMLIAFRLTGGIVKVVQMFISRSREACADAFASDLTNDPCALARALKRLVAHETKLAAEEKAKQEQLRLDDPIEFHQLHLARMCELAVLDALGLMMFVDTLACIRPSAASIPANTIGGKLRRVWQRLNENHPPVEDRCQWLELVAGQTCPCPGVDAPADDVADQN